MEAGGLELAERVRWRPEACLVSEVARPLPWPRRIPYICAGYRLVENIFFKFDFFSLFRSVKSLASGKKNVRCPDGLDFDILPDIRTGRDVQ